MNLFSHQVVDLVIFFVVFFSFYNLIFTGINEQNKKLNAIKYFAAPTFLGSDLFAYGKATGNYQKGFQPAATDVAEGIISFHDDLMFFIVFICIFVFSLLGMCLTKFSKDEVGVVSQRFVHAATLEIV